MRASLVLCVAAALVGGARAACDACLEGHCYNKHLITEYLSLHSALYWEGNILYHYYKNSDGEEFIKKCNLGKATCIDKARISHINNLAVDQHTGDLYGTNFDYPGIYKLDFANAKKELWVNVSSVWSLTFKDYLYYTTIDGGINVFKNGTSHLLAGTKQYNVKDMIVDRYDDIYFYDYTPNGRFLKMLSKGVISEPEFGDNHDLIIVTDKYGNSIFIDKNTNAVYRIINGQEHLIGALSEDIKLKQSDKHMIDRDNNIVLVLSISESKPEAWNLKKESDSACNYSCEEPKCKIERTDQ